jgi:hypothetical protein
MHIICVLFPSNLVYSISEDSFLYCWLSIARNMSASTLLSGTPPRKHCASQNLRSLMNKAAPWNAEIDVRNQMALLS